ncbi:MAG: hypothetical protein GSR85_06075 [Desulfurococcales archaeon]|nr:hypothetical protein [Desulfurococcales archaeon]
MQELELTGIGYGTLEAIPIYHLMPGGTVLRLLLRTKYTLDLNCEWAEICWIDRLSSGRGFKLNVNRLPSLMASIFRTARADTILIDGIDTLCLDILSTLKSLKSVSRALLAVRLHGSTDECIDTLGDLELEYVDYILFDYVAPISSSVVDLSDKQLRLLEWLIEKHKPLEVVAYVNDAKYEYLIPLIELLKSLDSTSTPMHIIIRNNELGVGISDLKNRLSKSLEYFYIHAGIYSELDTYCPKCRSPVASRSPGVLRSINVKEGRCPICGNSIPFRSLIYNRTPRHIITVTRGETRWYHPAERIPPGYSY